MVGMKVVIGNFCRETVLSKNPQLDEKKLVEQVEDILRDYNGVNGGAVEVRRKAAKARVHPGYRDGVILVTLRDSQGFKRRVRELVEGDHLFGQYRARVKGETPRKAVKVLHVGELPDAKYVDAVLYRRDVLAEDGDVSDPTADYEIVTFLAKDSPEPEPMDPDTLVANHFRWDGGTSTNMSDSEFVAALKKSVDYWKNKAHIF